MKIRERATPAEGTAKAEGTAEAGASLTCGETNRRIRKTVVLVFVGKFMASPQLCYNE